MSDLQTRFNEDSEYELLNYLKTLFVGHIPISELDKKEMKEYETTNYALIGLIGLLINSKARILLGKKQVYHTDIQQWCNAIETTDDDLMLIADKYLDDDFEDEPEFILRKVMLEYPTDS